MPHKHLLFNSAVPEKILHGATALADAVRVTLQELLPIAVRHAIWVHRVQPEAIWSEWRYATLLARDETQDPGAGLDSCRRIEPVTR